MYRAKVNGEWCGVMDKDARAAARDGFYVVDTNPQTGKIEAYEVTGYSDQYGKFHKRKLPDANIEIKKFNIDLDMNFSYNKEEITKIGNGK